MRIRIQGSEGEKKEEDDEEKRTTVYTGLTDISNSSRLDHVSDSESLDGLVLSNTTRTVGASDECDVSAALFVTAVISSLLGLRMISDCEHSFAHPQSSSASQKAHPSPLT